MLSWLELIGIFLEAQVFKLMDSIIVNEGLQRPYYGVHVVHNLLIVLITGPDVWSSFANFQQIHQYEPNHVAANLCFALHLYHIMYYWRAFRFDDWLHHGLMVGIALPLSLSLRTGPLLGANLFFTTGLPGAISYGLLFANRNGWLASQTAKRWNAATNLWIRAPGCVMHATLSLLAIFIVPRVSVDQTIATVLIAALTAWNGLYFMEQSIRANVVAQAALHPQHE